MAIARVSLPVDSVDRPPKRRRFVVEGEEDEEPPELEPRVPIAGLRYRIWRQFDPAQPDGRHYVRHIPGSRAKKFIDSYICRYQREINFENTASESERQEVEGNPILRGAVEKTSQQERKPNSSLNRVYSMGLFECLVLEHAANTEFARFLKLIEEPTRVNNSQLRYLPYLITRNGENCNSYYIN